MQVFRHRLLVERADRLDRGFDQLAAGIAERRKVVAERVDLGLDRALGIFFEELLGAVEIHALFREPGVVVDDAVEQRAHVLHHRAELQADHAAAENLDVVPDADLVCRLLLEKKKITHVYYLTERLVRHMKVALDSLLRGYLTVLDRY